MGRRVKYKMGINLHTNDLLKSVLDVLAGKLHSCDETASGT